MGRKKLKEEEKKVKLSVAIDSFNFKKMNDYKINKSKFINWLIVEHFGKEVNNG